MANEPVSYSVIMSDGAIEVREYSAAVVAYVAVDGTRGGAVNSGFRLLADYIFGNNQQKAEIAMTAPVTQTRASIQPAVAPESMNLKADSWKVRFLMPAGYRLQTLPAPNDARVHFEAAPGHRVAAIRFSGFWSDANLTSHEIRLLQWMRKRGVTATSPATYAYYDPPWKLWFLRRIEVMISIDATWDPRGTPPAE